LDVLIDCKICQPGGQSSNEDFTHEHDATAHVGNGSNTSGISVTTTWKTLGD
jgi:hypothetical protein